MNSSHCYLTESQVADYHRDGYIIVPGVFTPGEVELLLTEVDMNHQGAVFGDAAGRKTRLQFWGELDSTILGAASKCPRIVNNVRILLGEECAFFHGKATLKEAHTGGAWEWHQDYGYWYDQGFVFPRMLSAFAALDRNTEENGCLQVLRGSHKMGRLTHVAVQNQTGVEPKRLEQIEKHFERVPVILDPGDVLFFHCNTLHTSGPNTSDRHRRNFIMCYSALANEVIGGRKGLLAVPCPTAPDDIIEQFARARGRV
jgi:ectoine hydroxylase-related dioxygenase (phytanoyl-CoA dioxygenase family)